MEHQSLTEVMKTNLEKILSTGCLIKDLDRGLLDFPAIVNNVKEDRDEHPDVDARYQPAISAISG